MGTRHLTLVKHEGKFKIAQYGQWDGYPEVTGAKVLEFLSDPTNLPKLIANFSKLYEPSETELEAIGTKADQIQKEAEEMLTDESNKDLTHSERKRILERLHSSFKIACPSLSRDLGAGILELVANAEEPVPIQLEVEFVEDDLYCEWAYAINVDEGVFEAYSGDYTEQWMGLSLREIETHLGLVGSWKLAGLPDKSMFFCDITRGKIGREEVDDEIEDDDEGDEGEEENSEGLESDLSLEDVPSHKEFLGDTDRNTAGGKESDDKGEGGDDEDEEKSDEGQSSRLALWLEDLSSQENIFDNTEYGKEDWKKWDRKGGIKAYVVAMCKVSTLEQAIGKKEHNTKSGGGDGAEGRVRDNEGKREIDESEGGDDKGGEKNDENKSSHQMH